MHLTHHHCPDHPGWQQYTPVDGLPIPCPRCRSTRSETVAVLPLADPALVADGATEAVYLAAIDSLYTVGDRETDTAAAVLLGVRHANNLGKMRQRDNAETARAWLASLNRWRASEGLPALGLVSARGRWWTAEAEGLGAMVPDLSQDVTR